MFKNVKQRIKQRIKTVKKTLVRIQIKDVRFTLLKMNGERYNRKFPKNLTWTEDQIKLREEIKNQEYKPNNKYPTISSDRVCVDGLHRLTSLIEYYPDDYEILVLKSDLKYRTTFWPLIFYVIFFSKD